MNGKKTLSVSVAGLVTALVFLIMHYTGDAPLEAGVVSASWASLVWTVVMVVMRLVTTGPVRGRASKVPPRPAFGDHRGWGRLDVMMIVCLLLMAGLSLIAVGCPTHQVCPDGDGVVTMVKVKAPSWQTARCSSDPPGRERLRLDGTRDGTMVIRCPAGQVPGPKPGTVAPCAAGAPCQTAELGCVTP